MTCHTDTRIYDEDNDCGYTVTLMEALRHCQVGLVLVNVPRGSRRPGV
jgi:hypothetical protein